MITRASNAKKHPGQVVINSSTRRPREVVQAERNYKAAEQEKIAAAREQGINEVAQIENDVREKKNIIFDRQKDKLSIPRVTRARKPRAATLDNQGKLLPVNK